MLLLMSETDIMDELSMAQQEEISSDDTESVSGSIPLQEAPSTRSSQYLIKEVFHPRRGFAIFMTILICLIGAILAVYLYFAA